MSFEFIKHTLVIGFYISLGFTSCTNEVNKANVDLDDCVTVVTCVKILDHNDNILSEDIKPSGTLFIVPPGCYAEAKPVFSLNQKGLQLFNSFNLGSLPPDIIDRAKSMVVDFSLFYCKVYHDPFYEDAVSKVQSINEQQFKKFVLTSVFHGVYKKDMSQEQVGHLYMSFMDGVWDL